MVAISVAVLAIGFCCSEAKSVATSKPTKLFCEKQEVRRLITGFPPFRQEL